MPNHRKSSVLLERSGRTKHDPQRKRTPPRGRGKLPSKPPPELHLDAQASRAWSEIVAAIPEGVASGSDRFMVEMAARLLGRMRGGRKFRASDFGQLRVVLGQLGLSPEARERLSVPGSEKKEEGFGDYTPEAVREQRSGAPIN